MTTLTRRGTSRQDPNEGVEVVAPCLAQGLDSNVTST